MIILMVRFNVKKPHLDEFIEAMKDDARGSVTHEYGCRRFDIIQDGTDPALLALCEVYDDDAAVEAHTEAPHFLKWQEGVKDWFDGEIAVSRCRNLFPNDYGNFDSAIAGVDESFFSRGLHVIHAPRIVKEDRIEAYIEASLGDARGSTRNEQGCLRFDLYQNVENPAELWLYEVYVNEAAFQYHTTTPHIKKWRETVADWYEGEQPPAVRGTNIWPPDNWNWSSGKPRG